MRFDAAIITLLAAVAYAAPAPIPRPTLRMSRE